MTDIHKPVNQPNPYVPASPPPTKTSGTPANSLTFPGPSTPAFVTPADKVKVVPQGGSLHALNWLDLSSEKPPFASVEAHFQLRDLDGIDQRSSQDLHGQVDLKVGLSRELLNHSVSEANKQAPDLDFQMSYDAKQGRYRIAISYPTRLGSMGLGSVYLQPQGDKLRLEVGGLAGGAAKLANALTLGYARQATESLVKQLTQDMGFKVASSSMTSYELAPDLANSPLFKEIPLAGGESLKLESLTPGAGSLVKIQPDASGNLSIQMEKIQAVASSQAGAAKAKPDAEGPDHLDIKAQVILNRDFSAEVNSTLNLDLNVQPSERAGLQQRLKNLTGQDLPVSGELRIEDLQVNAQIQANGQVKEISSSGGRLEAEALNLSLGPNQVQLSQVEGGLSLQQQAGQTRLGAEDVKLQGQIKGPQGQLNIQQLNFSGSLVHANSTPQVIGFELGANQSLAFSGDLQQGSDKIGIQELTLRNANLQTNLAQGQLELLPQAGKDPDARIKRLRLPDATLYDLRLQGSLTANLNTGSLSLNAKSFGFAAQAGDVKLKWLQGSGQLNLDAQGNLSLKQARFNTEGQFGELNISKLKGQGDLQVSANGQIQLQSVRNLELKTDQGLSLKGDFSGQIQGQQYQLQTQGKKSAQIDFHDPKLDLALSGVQVQGQMTLDAASGKLNFASLPGGELKLAAGEISGLTLKDVSMQGQIDYAPGQLVFSPGANGKLQASGQLDDVRIQDLESDGSVTYDLNRQTISWQGETQASLPWQGIQNLHTKGPVSIQILPSQELVFSSQNGTLNATLGDLRLENLKTNGQVIFDPKTQNLRFEGFDNQGLTLEGSFNGHPLKLSSSGQIQINDKGQTYQIRGEDIQIQGLVDGFQLASPSGATGTVSLKRDFSGFELNDLNFGFQVDDIQLDSQGTVRSTPDGGLEIRLQGALGSDKGQLQALLTKLAGREELGDQFQEGLQQVNQALDQAFADFKDASLNFEDLKLELDPQFQLKSFSVRNNSEIHNARMEVDLNGKKTLLPMGTVNWTADVLGTPQSVSVPQGQLAFSLTDELRGQVVAEVKKQLEDSGLKDVQLTFHPNGKLEIENATINRKRLNISAELEINTKIVDNHLEVSLDKVKLKNALFNLVAQIVNAPDKVSDEVDKMLQQQDVKYQRRNRKGQADPESGRIFRLDLQALMQQVDPGIQLKSASLNEQGRVQIDYAYQSKL